MAFKIIDLPEIEKQFPQFKLAPVWERLSGGNLNFVWRWGLYPNAVIVKQSPPYIAAAPEVALSTSRHEFEQKALSFLHHPSEVLGLSPSVQVPKLLAYDGQNFILILEDFGPSPSLARAFEQATFDLNWGKTLGLFIKGLHLQTATQPLFAQTHCNQAVQETRFAVQYQLIGARAKALSLPHATDLAEAATQLGMAFLERGQCLIMGDLWLPSILTTTSGLALIDWEFSHYGQPAQDLGHLAAHLWMLYHRSLDPQVQTRVRLFWEAFMTSYLSENALFDPVQHQRAIQHAGAEIMARTIGAFQAGFYYDGLPLSHPDMQAALEMAGRFLLMPQNQPRFLFHPTHWIGSLGA